MVRVEGVDLVADHFWQVSQGRLAVSDLRHDVQPVRFVEGEYRAGGLLADAEPLGGEHANLAGAQPAQLGHGCCPGRGDSSDEEHSAPTDQPTHVGVIPRLVAAVRGLGTRVLVHGVQGASPAVGTSTDFGGHAFSPWWCGFAELTRYSV
ncbi:MAG: hypothetical protein V9G19_19740 [Tetrasphaera sp.]